MVGKLLRVLYSPIHRLLHILEWNHEYIAINNYDTMSYDVVCSYCRKRKPCKFMSTSNRNI
jgi:hypothetical protein